ncbi:DNA protecting protein DprA [Catenulispora sp. GAS73]|uniref:DNA-processing protein DprA n=1 Tax=Catenulispora sp. GAS73 TaxID=3156269 RepID=UPI003517668D
MTSLLASPDTPEPTMTSLVATPPTPSPDLSTTVTLPRYSGPEPPAAPEPVPPPRSPDSLFYADANRTLAADPALSAAEPAPPNPEPLPLAPDPQLSSRAGNPTSPALSADAEDRPPSLLAPDSLFYKSSNTDPPTDPAPPAAPEPDRSSPEPSLLAPTSVFYAAADPTPPADSTPTTEPLLAPTSLFYATPDRSPSTVPEPPAAASDQDLTEPPGPPVPEPTPPPPTLRRSPEPVLVTAAPHDPTGAERRARLVLHHASEPGDALLCRLVARFGAPTVASALLSGSAADLLSSQDEASAGDRAALIARAHTLQTRCYRADPDADLAVGEKTGARYVIPADPQWPAALDDLGDAAPLGMWFLGTADLVAASRRAVSIVGARIATGYGMHVAGELAAGLAERGWAVISGAARGIDGAAHRGALAARGVTVAALACGIDLVYPAGHEALIGAIASDGLVVSELPPGTSVSRFRFLDRNRVIAALGLGTVVVEAASRSGSLVTARLADELGRPVLAVPGPVTSEASEGTHQLIRDGALLVTKAAEVIEQLGELGADLAERTSSRRPRDSLDPIAARVLDALPVAGRGTLDTVEAALAAGLEPRTVHQALNRLTAAGWVDRDERGWCARLLP